MVFGISVYFNGQTSIRVKSCEEAQGSYRFSHLGRSTRLYVVVMFDLWEVHCLRVVHTDRDGGWSGAGLIFGAHLCQVGAKTG
jgi:hypothetical protein